MYHLSRIPTFAKIMLRNSFFSIFSTTYISRIVAQTSHDVDVIHISKVLSSAGRIRTCDQRVNSALLYR